MKIAWEGFFIVTQHIRVAEDCVKHMAMEGEPTFETYLQSKKIDSEAFRKAEPDVWLEWKREFEQMHPNSFTVQKLNLINPIRRKYLLATAGQITATPEAGPSPAPSAAPRPGRPVIRPKRD